MGATQHRMSGPKCGKESAQDTEEQRGMRYQRLGGVRRDFTWESCLACLIRAWDRWEKPLHRESSLAWGVRAWGFFSFLFFNKFIYFISFIFLFLAALGLHCCVQAFLWLQRAGVTLHRGAQASHWGGFSCCGAWALGMRASVVVAHGLGSCGSWALEHRLSSCGTRA